MDFILGLSLTVYAIGVLIFASAGVVSKLEDDTESARATRPPMWLLCIGYLVFSLAWPVGVLVWWKECR